MTDAVQALLFDHAASDTSATRVGTIARPHPGRGEVAINVGYAGVNFKDVMSRRGDPGYVASWPYVPGIEVAGTVAEVGASVSDLRIDEPVVALTNDGGLAQVAIAPAALTVRVPEGIELGVAAAAPGALTTAELLLDLAGMKAGDALLVHSAAGGVGRAIAQLARHTGAGLLVGTVGDAARCQAARANGYDTVIVRDGDLVTTLDAATDAGFSVILDPQGTTLLDADLSSAAPGARIIIFGNADGTSSGPLPGLATLFAKSLSIGAFSLKGLSIAAPARVRAAMTRVLELLDTGVLDLPTTHLSGLSAAAEAQQALAESRGTGKYIVALNHQ